MSEPAIYPYSDGDIEVIGPECFTDGEVICYRGENYARQRASEVTGQVGERDELAKLLCTIDGRVGGVVGGRELAQGILAAGYRLPRTITTAEDAQKILAAVREAPDVAPAA